MATETAAEKKQRELIEQATASAMKQLNFEDVTKAVTEHMDKSVKEDWSRMLKEVKTEIEDDVSSRIIHKIEQLDAKLVERTSPVRLKELAEAAATEAAEEALEEQIRKAEERAMRSAPVRGLLRIKDAVVWALEPLKPRRPTKEGVRNVVLVEIMTLGTVRYFPPARNAMLSWLAAAA